MKGTKENASGRNYNFKPLNRLYTVRHTHTEVGETGTIAICKKILVVKGRGKAIPITGSEGPSRVQHLLDSRFTDGGKVVKRMRGRPLLPGRFLVVISDRG
jgi:hypothetical protein